MAHLPLITAIGGINPAGRSSFHHAFQRLIFDVLPEPARVTVLKSLASLAGEASEPLDAPRQARLLERTLIRQIDPACFDTGQCPGSIRADLRPADGPVQWQMRRRELPSPVPEHWKVIPLDEDRVEIHAADATPVLLPTAHRSRVSAAGQLPGGFDPGQRYPSRHHPRGLQMAICAASDAVMSLGIEWQTVMDTLAPDQIAVHASSAMGQLDDAGAGGMLQSAVSGRRTTSKQCPFSLADMPADFVNAYVLGGLGPLGGTLGACATFLFNLERAVQEIRAGQVKIAIVGAAEAPITPEIIEGYRIMGALAEDHALLALDGQTDGVPDYRRACRPFGNNCGFTLGESAQYIILMADDLALALGAPILGAVPGVFINGDGIKQSISSPGVGNYLTLGRAAALTRSLIGDTGLRRHALLHAHGTGTPQNRVTESHVFDTVAAGFGIERWAVAATKCYTGHSLGPAAGDQLCFALGSLESGWVPGIATVSTFADDVHRQRLDLRTSHREEAPDHWQAALLNSKGFGGNNASATLLSAVTTHRLLERRHGGKSMAAWQRRNLAVQERKNHYESALLSGRDQVIYRYGESAADGQDVQFTDTHIHIRGHHQAVSLEVDNPWGCLG